MCMCAFISPERAAECVLSSAVEQVDANKRVRERGENMMGNLHIEVMFNIQPDRNRKNRREGNMRCILWRPCKKCLPGLQTSTEVNSRSCLECVFEWA